MRLFLGLAFYRGAGPGSMDTRWRKMRHEERQEGREEGLVLFVVVGFGGLVGAEEEEGEERIAVASPFARKKGREPSYKREQPPFFLPLEGLPEPPPFLRWLSLRISRTSW